MRCCARGGHSSKAEHLVVAQEVVGSSPTGRPCVGAWRSPEARLHGVQEVGGSNPLAPTTKSPRKSSGFLLLSRCVDDGTLLRANRW